MCSSEGYWDNLVACLYPEAFIKKMYLLAVLRAEVGVRGVQVKADVEADLRSSSSREYTGHTFDQSQQQQNTSIQRWDRYCMISLP